VSSARTTAARRGATPACRFVPHRQDRRPSGNLTSSSPPFRLLRRATRTRPLPDDGRRPVAGSRPFGERQDGGNDVVFAPSDPSVVYASLWENYPDIAGPESGVYKSTDGGATCPPGGGLPDGPKTGDRPGRLLAEPHKALRLRRQPEQDKNLAAELTARPTADGRGRDARESSRSPGASAGISAAARSIRATTTRSGPAMWTLHRRRRPDVDLGGESSMSSQSVRSSTRPLRDLRTSRPDHFGRGQRRRALRQRGQGRRMHSTTCPSANSRHRGRRADPYTVYAGSQDDASVYGPAGESEHPMVSTSGSTGRAATAASRTDPGDLNTVYFGRNGAICRGTCAPTAVGIMPARKRERIRRLQLHRPAILSPHDRFTLPRGQLRFKSTTGRC
jgi:hypothetical protein